MYMLNNNVPRVDPCGISSSSSSNFLFLILNKISTITNIYNIVIKVMLLFQKLVPINIFQKLCCLEII